MRTVTEPYRLLDFQPVAGKLKLGHWLVYPYEAYGQLDRDEWNTELLKEMAERGVAAEVIDLPRKNVAVVVNVAAQPTLEQVIESIAAIEYHRFTGREIRDELAVKTSR